MWTNVKVLLRSHFARRLEYGVIDPLLQLRIISCANLPICKIPNAAEVDRKYESCKMQHACILIRHIGITCVTFLATNVTYTFSDSI